MTDRTNEMNDSLDFYKPVVSMNGSNVLFEKDRQNCLDRAKKMNKDNASNSSIAAFRQCLIDKGYTLLS
jgi:hypothetical protein